VIKKTFKQYILDNSMRKIAILGAGLTGLSSAWKLSENNKVEVIEKNDYLGGISGSFKHDEYTLDYGPHKIYTQIPYIQKEIEELVGKDNLLEIPKRSRIYLKKKFFNYPVSFIELILKLNPLLTFKIGMSFMFRKIRNIFYKKEKTYEDYISNRFGHAMYKLIFEPYAEKVWGDPKKLSYELAKTRVSIPNLSTLIKSMIFKKSNPEISADVFYYPKYGISTLAERMWEEAEINKGKLHLNSNIKNIKVKDNFIEEIRYKEKSKEKKIKSDFVVSTIPINELPKLMNAPNDVKKAAKKLEYRSLILLYIIINKKRLFLDNWIFFPEKDIIFNRISEQKGFSVQNVPGDKTVLTVEISAEEDGYLMNLDDKELFEKAIIDLEKTGILTRNDVESYFLIKMDKTYPVYDLNFKKNLNVILEYLSNIKNLITNGRQGLFNYNNMDHCIDMGIKAARYIENEDTNWSEITKEFENYKIVD